MTDRNQIASAILPAAFGGSHNQSPQLLLGDIYLWSNLDLEWSARG
jgi:hypothetical protein